MRYSLYILLAFLCVARSGYSQVGIGTESPIGELEIVSTTGGLTFSRMTQAQRDLLVGAGNATTGTVIYQTNQTAGLYYYDGTQWQPLGTDNLGDHSATQALELNDNYLLKDFINTSNNETATYQLVHNDGTGNFSITINSTTGNSADYETDGPAYRYLLRTLGSGGTNQNYAFEYAVPGTAGSDISWSTAYAIDPTNGYFGIGTVDPQALLHVDGSARMSSVRLTTGATNGYILQSDADGDATWVAPNSVFTDTDEQQLSFTSTTLSLTDGGSVDLVSLRDNLGNHTATENVQLGSNWLSGDGGDEGIRIDGSGHIGLGVAPSGSTVVYGYSSSNLDAFNFVQADGLTGERDVFTIEDQDNGGGGQDHSSVLHLHKSGDINSGDDGFSVLEMTMSGADPGSDKYWLSGRTAENGAPLFGVDLTDNDYWSSGGLTLGVSSSTGGTYSGGTFRVNADGSTAIGSTTVSSGTMLDVSGKSRTTTFQMTSGATNGYVLQSDGAGNGTWVDPSSLSSGDNLGNHTATENIRLNNRWLSNDGGNEGLQIDNSGRIAMNGSTVNNYGLTVYNGAFFSTDTNADPVIIARQPDMEERLQIGLTDNDVFYRYVNDEEQGKVSFTIQNTDTETGGGADANTSQVLTLYADQNGSHVGINTANPTTYALEVSGVTSTTNFRMTNGATNGYVLTSDANGNASWQAAGSSPWQYDGNSIKSNVSGANNDIQDKNHSVAGGQNNTVNANYSATFGRNHSLQADYTFTAGNDVDVTSGGTFSAGFGLSVDLEAPYTFAAGQNLNVEDNHSAAFGYNNTVQSPYGFVAGRDNTIGTGDPGAAVFGGSNDVNSNYTLVAGYNNYVNNSRFSLTVGEDNSNQGSHSFISGENSAITVNSNHAVALGRRAKVQHNGSFVFKDDDDTELASSSSDQMMMGFSGGYRFYTNDGYTTGVRLNTGNNTWSSLSDRRAKTQIEDLATATDRVAALRPVEYFYKSDSLRTHKTMGFIAQEVAEVLPEVVDVPNQAEQMYTIRYTELIPILTKALQEQQQANVDLESEVDTLRGEVQSLKAQLENYRTLEERLTRLEKRNDIE